MREGERERMWKRGEQRIKERKRVRGREVERWLVREGRHGVVIGCQCFPVLPTAQQPRERLVSLIINFSVPRSHRFHRRSRKWKGREWKTQVWKITDSRWGASDGRLRTSARMSVFGYSECPRIPAES